MEKNAIKYAQLLRTCASKIIASERSVLAHCMDKEFGAIRKKLKHTRDFSDADVKKILKHLDAIQAKYLELEKQEPDTDKEAIRNDPEMYQRMHSLGEANPLGSSHGPAYKEALTLLDWYKDVVIRNNPEQRGNISSVRALLLDLEEKEKRLPPAEVAAIRKDFISKLSNVADMDIRSLVSKLMSTEGNMRERDRGIQTDIERIYKRYGTTREEVKAQRSQRMFQPLKTPTEDAVQSPIKGIESEVLKAVRAITNIISERTANIKSLSPKLRTQLREELQPITDISTAMLMLVQKTPLTSNMLSQASEKMIGQSAKAAPIYKDLVSVVLDANSPADDKRSKIQSITEAITKGSTESVGFSKGVTQKPEIVREVQDLGSQFKDFMSKNPDMKLAAQYAMKRLAYVLQVI